MNDLRFSPKGQRPQILAPGVVLRYLARVALIAAVAAPVFFNDTYRVLPFEQLRLRLSKEHHPNGTYTLEEPFSSVFRCAMLQAKTAETHEKQGFI